MFIAKKKIIGLYMITYVLIYQFSIHMVMLSLHMHFLCFHVLFFFCDMHVLGKVADNENGCLVMPLCLKKLKFFSMMLCAV